MWLLSCVRLKQLAFLSFFFLVRELHFQQWSIYVRNFQQIALLLSWRLFQYYAISYSTRINRHELSRVSSIWNGLIDIIFSKFFNVCPFSWQLYVLVSIWQLVENVVICLMKIAERVSHSSEMLDELCKHGIINQATHLIHLNSRTTLSQPIYNVLAFVWITLFTLGYITF